MDAPYPESTKAGGFRFELDCERVTQSDTWALANARQRPLLLMLWFIAWQQIPCGTLPADDALIAARLGLEPDAFQHDKALLLRGWEAAVDGRLYHGAITDLVLEMLGRKTRDAKRKADYRQRQKDARMSHGTPEGRTQDQRGTDAGVTRESAGSDDTTTTTTTTKKNKKLSSSAVPSDAGGELVQRLGQVTDEAIAVFNASPLTKRNGGSLPNVSETIGREKRQQQVGRCLRTARAICLESTGSPLVTSDFWEAYFDLVAGDKFYSGRQGGGPGYESYTPNFELLTREATMLTLYDRQMAE